MKRWRIGTDRREVKPGPALAAKAVAPTGSLRAASIMARSKESSTSRPKIRLQSPDAPDPNRYRGEGKTDRHNLREESRYARPLAVQRAVD